MINNNKDNIRRTIIQYNPKNIRTKGSISHNFIYFLLDTLSLIFLKPAPHYKRIFFVNSVKNSPYPQTRSLETSFYRWLVVDIYINCHHNVPDYLSPISSYRRRCRSVFTPSVLWLSVGAQVNSDYGWAMYCT